MNNIPLHILYTVAEFLTWLVFGLCVLRLALHVRRLSRENNLLFEYTGEQVRPLVAFARLNPAAKIPAYAYPGDSGMDLSSCEKVTIRARSSAKIHTGIAAQLMPWCELQLRPRSGLSKLGIAAAFGTIDNGYRGEICVVLYNHTDNDFTVNIGDRIAQLVIAQVAQARIHEIPADKLAATKTKRGDNGFGSTGK
jgi:dUTP pyrophosphatase